jgi:type IV pilus assembly protein PilN
VISINLLPHRAAARRRRRQHFYAGLGGAALLGCLLAALTYGWIEAGIARQEARNGMLKTALARLDLRIAQTAALQSEMATLRAHIQAVEALQAERNLPVHLLNALAHQLPEGVYLTRMKEDGPSVTLQGVAQSNERVSELLHRLGHDGPWLAGPELVEITAAHPASEVLDPRDPRVQHEALRVARFTVRAVLRRPAHAGASAGPDGLGARAAQQTLKNSRGAALDGKSVSVGANASARQE